MYQDWSKSDALFRSCAAIWPCLRPSRLGQESTLTARHGAKASMKLNRKLRQRCWLEVKHFVLDDSFGCCLPIWYCPFITSTNRQVDEVNR